MVLRPSRTAREVSVGYRRENGEIGIRNYIEVIYTVLCSSKVAQDIARGYEDVQVYGFPGCYENEYALRLMSALGTHPNVAAVLIVGMGCEGTDISLFAEMIAKSGRPVEVLRIHDCGGTLPTIDKGRQIVESLIDHATNVPQEPIDPSDLVLASKCGGSDGTSGLAANPAVGKALDLHIDKGGTGIFEEILELLGCEKFLMDRAMNEKVAAKIERALDKAKKFSIRTKQFGIVTGDYKDGGLTTIEEKSAGGYLKTGTQPIMDVIKVAESPPGKGLYMMDSVPDDLDMIFGYSNPNDSEGFANLASGGSHAILFTTGWGSVIGSVVAPLVKVCGNPKNYEKMTEDMDINAGTIIEGKKSIGQVGQAIYEKVLRVADGERTKTEILGHEEHYIFYKYQHPQCEDAHGF